MEVPTLSMRSPLHTEAGELLEGLSVEVGMECKSVTAESGVSDRGTFLSFGDTEGCRATGVGPNPGPPGPGRSSSMPARNLEFCYKFRRSKTLHNF